MQDEVEGTFRQADNLCFLPAGGYLFTQKFSEVCAPGYTDGTVQLMRALWAAWFFKGGVPATAKELRAIVEDLVADLKQGSDQHRIVENKKDVPDF